MKIKFKEQRFQLDAVQAVVDCFAGQKLKTNRFTLQRSADLIKKAKQEAQKAVQSSFSEELFEDIGYRNSTIRITPEQILNNIQEVQKKNDIILNRELDIVPRSKLGLNLTIDMETGTGKTYTYIRTMYELNKHYGWSKFIIVVPSIAIREGIHKSFDMTEEHFQEIYGHKINRFIYDSSRPQDIESFAADNRISVMIINTQAFASRSATARRIYQELDQFGSRKPIEIISKTNPILIIDEPQSVGRVGSASLEKMEEFEPLFILRYSATHAEVYNKVFRLDALDAYRMQLVKKIQVKGINLKGTTGTSGYLYLEHIEYSANNPPVAIVEYEERRSGGGARRVRRRLSQGDNLFVLSGELPAYQNMTISEIDGFQNKIVIAGQDVYPGDVLNNDEDEALFRRIQIRETIKSHLEKEKQMFKRGVKVLSLFFIDEVAKYRQYDEDGEPTPGEYAKMFEEEYAKAVYEYIDLFDEEFNKYLHDTHYDKIHKLYAPEEYKQYLRRDKADEVHQGYFSIDKKGRAIDSAIKRGSDYSDDVSAYELIMKDKERLLSFDEPTRFIFSHSALKEGWDNPNVFQICTLKNSDSGSEIRRRQEVGRGMRLCVNKEGVRQDSELLGGQVHDINRLTVVASESYEDFARGLQKEIADTLGERPTVADINYFTNKVLTDNAGVTKLLTANDAANLLFELRGNNILDKAFKVTDEGIKAVEENTLTLSEDFQPYVASISSLLQNVYMGIPPAPVDERKNITVSTNANYDKQEFQELWSRINLKTVYEVRFDTDKLIEDSKNKINKDLNISKRRYQIITGEQRQVNTKEELKQGEGIVATDTANETINSDIYSDTVYDLIGEIENLTNLKRTTIVAILQKIKQDKFFMFRQNPEEFIGKVAGIINEVKASLIFNNIVYHKIEERFDAKTIFGNEQNMLRSDTVLKKHIYDFINTDSKTEQEFARNLELAAEVVVYAKLPRGFYISTPTGKYNPDWAIVLDKDKVKHIYFIAETKGSDKESDLRTVEQLKIHCATEHFKAISGTEVKFDVIHNYGKLLEVAQLK